jgi:hypothetical protein
VGPKAARDEDLIVSGAMREVTLHVINVIKVLVEEQKDWIAAELGGKRGKRSKKQLRLLRPHLALHVHLESWGKPPEASYQGAALYVAMAGLLVEKRPREDTVVFGDVAVNGALASSWRWGPSVIEHCRKMGVRRAVVPEGMVLEEEAKRLAEEVVEGGDGRPAVEVIKVRNMLQALPHVFGA